MNNIFSIFNIKTDVGANDLLDQEVWEETKKREKKKRKEQKPELDRRGSPRLRININTEALNDQKKIDYNQLRNFIIWLLSGDTQYEQEWIFVKNIGYLKNVYFFHVPGLDYQFVKKVSKERRDLKFFGRHLADRNKFLVVEGDGVLNRCYPTLPKFLNFNIMYNTLAKYRARKRINRGKSLDSLVDLRSKVPLEYGDLLLTEAQLSRNGYPQEADLKGSFRRFPPRKSFGSSVTPYDVVSIDCEMVLTTKRLELARITCVDSKYNLVMDEFVMPKRKIVDYKTKYSGITPELLRGVKTTREDIFKKLSEVISADTIIVGHGLENDLRQLKVVHDRVIDTSVCYAQTGRRKPRLKYLAKKYLGMDIQQETQEDGHSSMEDAIATMKLVNMKIQNGIDFGIEKGANTYKDKDNLLAVASEYANEFIVDDWDTAQKLYDIAVAAAPSDLDERLFPINSVGEEMVANAWFSPAKGLKNVMGRVRAIARIGDSVLEYVVDEYNGEALNAHKFVWANLQCVENKRIPFKTRNEEEIGKNFSVVSEELNRVGAAIERFTEETMTPQDICIVYSGNGTLTKLVGEFRKSQLDPKNEEIKKTISREAEISRQGVAIVFTKK